MTDPSTLGNDNKTWVDKWEKGRGESNVLHALLLQYLRTLFTLAVL